MDRILEDAIKETGTLVPVPNPNFDPAKYRPEMIGEPSKKHSGKSKAAKGKNKNK